MSNLDLFRKELMSRGLTQQQANSKAVAVALDVLSNSGNTYTAQHENEQTATALRRDLEEQVRMLEHRKSAFENELSRLRREIQDLRDYEKKVNEYVDTFDRSLTECETAEERDTMRKLQFFMNNVDVETKYDNTAYIVALGAILSHGKVGAIEELHKINKRIPNTESFRF